MDTTLMKQINPRTLVESWQTKVEEDKISQTGMEKLEQRLGNQTEYGNLRPVQSEP